MAAPATLPALLDTLTKSLTTTLEATPKLSSFDLPEDGISLLNVKNELLLSYLQNLVFLILLKLRQSRNGDPKQDKDGENLDDLVVNKLVELRLYLEKGVRPLEDKLKYQIDKVLRAADDAERAEKQAADAAAIANGEKSDEDSDSEAGSEDDEESGAKLDTAAGGVQARANLGAWKRPAAATASAGKSIDKSGVYRPPKIAPVSMPTTERRERKEKKPMKSHTLDEFIADEMSTAPVAQPSIGTTIMQFGRKIKTSSERAKEDERRDYEERNFVRLPKESKKDKAKRGIVEGRRMNFGGEEWRGLSEGVDRISKLTKGKSTGGGTKALLEKSRKRGLDTTDGPRGSGGASMGERFQKRLKTVELGRGRKGR
ncbi:Sas10/Utp3/C1D family-domain-containing protein [Podospora australis]|uniref:Sas10/Utp3/C1D family-domain-containing protein n=1 Tax=Podospora australis TaxID=1536484 RepID=A0AAN7ADL1_9PEZI|nr:Sas10/Utp3/C1D family-domain-containing protein [Podospora australis]